MEKQYKNVVEMLNDISDDKEFNKSVEKEINTKQIAKTLFAMRCKTGLNQAEIAKKMNCTQGKVSKMENSLDVDISVGDLVKYCSAVNMQLEVNFFDRRLKMADKVKYCYFQLKTLLDKIIEMEKGDEAMGRGVEKFAREAFVNISFGLIECLEKAKVKKEIAAPLHVSAPVNLEEVNAGAGEQKNPITQTAQP
jgi:transcriptional regulator with XRE-family HTH domain